MKFLRRAGSGILTVKLFAAAFLLKVRAGALKSRAMISFNYSVLTGISAAACISAAGCAFAGGEGAPEKPVPQKEAAAPAESPKYALSDYRNFFGMCWSADSNADLLDYARQMGHTHVVYRKGMENLPQAKGMKFFIEDPEFGARRRMLDYGKKYSQSEIDDIQSHYVVIYHDKEFPHNMASSWFVPPNTRSLTLDFQQQAVIDDVVGRLVKRIKGIEKKNPDFKFAGFTWDVPHPSGNFRLPPKPHVKDIHKAQGREVTLAHWTGKDSSIPFKGRTHEYETYSEGKLAFYDKLRREGAKINPDVKMMSEPYNLYEGWIRRITPELAEKMKSRGMEGYRFDFLWQEGDGDAFVADKRILEGGYDRAHVGSSTPNISDTGRMLAESVAAATNGSWTAWYGRAGGTANSPNYRHMREIPARLKLFKAVPTWENLNNTPVSERKWDAEKKSYDSPTAHMGEDCVWGKHPRDDKMFLVFLSPKAEARLPKGKRVKAVYATDGLFRELMDLRERDRAAKIKPRVRVLDDKIRLLSNDLINEGLVLHLEDAPKAEAEK